MSGVQEKDGRFTAAVEQIDQISKHDINAVKSSFDVEWKTALTNTGANSLDQFESPAKAEYWTEPKRKVARVSSDPKTPER